MTDNSLRTALARALFEAYGDTTSPGWDAEYPSMKRTYFDQADAVLAVLADPPDAVIEQAAQALDANFNADRYPILSAMFRDYVAVVFRAAFGGEQSDG